MDDCEFESPSSSSSNNSNKNTVNIVKNWYQSVYFWNVAYNQAQFATTQNLLNHHHHHHVSSTPRSTPTATLPRQDTQHSLNSTYEIEPESYKVPSLPRRFLAEAFDAFYVQIFKIVILVIIINYTSLMDDEITSIRDLLENLLDEDNFMVSAEFLAIEIIYISISFIFEFICLYKYGFTPGKYVFKLKVVSCNQVNTHQNTMIQVIPGTKISLKIAIFRTLLKNFSILLFPTILIFLAPAFMEYGQTWYDKAAETLVVEIAEQP